MKESEGTSFAPDYCSGTIHCIKIFHNTTYDHIKLKIKLFHWASPGTTIYIIYNGTDPNAIGGSSKTPSFICSELTVTEVPDIIS